MRMMDCSYVSIHDITHRTYKAYALPTCMSATAGVA
jgi:hypothetical protein